MQVDLRSSRCWVVAVGFLALGQGAGAQEPYKRPPQNVIDILDAPPTPFTVPSPTRDNVLLVDYEAYSPVALLARPFLRLGGVRVDPQRWSRQRTRQFTGIAIVTTKDGATRRVELPSGARIQLPVWSSDGQRFAFARDRDDGVELWVGEAATGAAHAVGDVQLNDILSAPIEWARDNTHLLVHAVAKNHGPAPAAATMPVGPKVQVTAGKQSRMATFQDLSTDEHDEALFEYYGTSQLELVDVATGTAAPIGKPGLFLDTGFSPDETYLLAVCIQRPFSFRVPFDGFTHTIEVWRPDGSQFVTVAKLPVADEVPQQGVPTGPRDVQWQPLVPATLVWTEALDGGDPRTKVPQRDKLVALAMADLEKGTTTGRELLRTKNRCVGVRWTGRPNQALVGEFDRDRRWATTSFVDLTAPEKSWRTVFDLSANDAYNDPGRPVEQRRPDGEVTLLQDGDWIYLSGRGATQSGDRPFLDRLNLKTLKKERLFVSDATGLEAFLTFGPGEARKSVLTSRQSRTEPPNLFMVDLGAKPQRRRLTNFTDPAPQLTGIEKQLVKYHRADGVPLSGILYLPPGYKRGTRLPLVVWAYPLEYSDAGTAGQVRSSPNSFTRLMGDSPLFFLTQGYAVLNDATMPVIGDPETMNDTYVDQIVAAAKAAIDTLDTMGVIDRDRVCVAGHSYGAFMTVNLLAHSDLFAAGIARSGAYNRTLTPFGFQAERRSYWEATDVYTHISPFTYANKINEPLLLIHGEEDNNSGTFPIQSERLFQAIQGNGGTARLVMLPYEAHGYRARESILTVLAEMFDWCDKYVKNRPPATHEASRR